MYFEDRTTDCGTKGVPVKSQEQGTGLRDSSGPEDDSLPEGIIWGASRFEILGLVVLRQKYGVGDPPQSSEHLWVKWNKKSFISGGFR